MKQYGAVYGDFTWGAAILAAKAIKNVKCVEWDDLGITEAIWIFEVEDFRSLTVAVDSHEENLFEDVQMKVKEKRIKI